MRIACDAEALRDGLDGNGTVTTPSARVDFNRSVTITCREGYTVDATANLSLNATCGIGCAFSRTSCVPVSTSFSTTSH